MIRGLFPLSHKDTRSPSWNKLFADAGTAVNRSVACSRARATVSGIKIRALSIINIRDGDHLHTRSVSRPHAIVEHSHVIPRGGAGERGEGGEGGVAAAAWSASPGKRRYFASCMRGEQMPRRIPAESAVEIADRKYRHPITTRLRSVVKITTWK